MTLWTSPIRYDPDWNGGNYYDGTEPMAGLAHAYEVVFRDALAPGFMDASFGRKWAEEGADPGAAWDNEYQAEKWIKTTAAGYAQTGEPNHFLCQGKAIQLFVAGGRASAEDAADHIRARLLLLPAALSRAIESRVKANGIEVTFQEIPGGNGHLNIIWAITGVGETIRTFLDD